MLKPSIALVIQGPLHKNMVRQIVQNYLYFKKIVVSTWEAKDEEELEILEQLLILESKNSQITIVVSAMTDISHSALPQKFHLQVLTTLKALNYVNQTTVVKTRSDEFMDLARFKSFVEESRKQFQFSNFIVRDWLYHSFHISDHLYAAPRENLVWSMNWLLSARIEELKESLQEDWNCPESLLGYALLNSTVPDLKNCKSKGKMFQIFKSKFTLFDLEMLEYFEVRANSAGTGYLTGIRHITLEIADLINWNYFSRIEQMRPSRLKSFTRKRVQPWVRQFFLKLKRKTRRPKKGVHIAHIH